MQSGSKCRHNEETNTPLLDAVLTNHTELALQLIDEDITVLSKTINQSCYGNTALLLAIENR